MNKFARLICLVVLTSFGIQPTIQASPLTVTNGLSLWLKADSLALNNGDPVSTWTDSSPVGNNGTNTVTPPTYQTGQFGYFNQFPGVTFDGVNDYLQLYLYGNHALNATPLTYFTVFKSADTVGGPGIFPENAIVSDISGGIGLSFGVNAGKGFFSEYNGGGWTALNGSGTVSDGQAHILSLTDPTYSANTSTTAYMYVDGNLDSTVATTFGLFRSYNTIGYGFGSQHFDGSIAEILVYHAALSDADRLSVETYLSDKYFAIPEPTTLVLFALGAGAMFARRRSQ